MTVVRLDRTPEKLFLLISAVIGSVLVFLVPPFQGPDEDTHFIRACAVSEGNLIPVFVGGLPGAYMSSVVPELVRITSYASNQPDQVVRTGDVRSGFQMKWTRGRVFQRFSGASVYTAVPYLPSAFGILVLRSLDTSPLSALYAARVMNFLCATLLMCAAIWLAPFLRWAFFAVGVMPMTLFLRSVVSADGLALGATFLFAALVFRAMARRFPFSYREALQIGCAGLFVAVTKPSISVFLLLLIPLSRLKPARAIPPLLLCLALVVSGLFLANQVTNRFYVPTRPGTDARLQALRFSAHPGEMLRLTFADLGRHGQDHLYSFVGVLGMLDTWLPKWVYWTYPLLLLAVCLNDPETQSRPSWPMRGGLALLWGIGSFLVFLSQYLFWTPVGGTFLEGVQGRYWLPLTPLLMLSLAREGWLLLNRRVFGGIVAYVSLVQLTTVAAVYIRYYGI